MAGDKPIVCVDTCILIAWVTGEQRPVDDMQGLASLGKQVDSEEIILIASTLFKVEMLESRTPQLALDQLEKLFKRSNVKAVPADMRVTSLAGEIRSYYQAQRGIDGKPGLCTPDAIHLATAIHARASVFLTFDRYGNKNCRGLLPLSMNVAGHRLRVEPPRAIQTEMPL